LLPAGGEADAPTFFVFQMILSPELRLVNCFFEVFSLFSDDFPLDAYSSLCRPHYGCNQSIKGGAIMEKNCDQKPNSNTQKSNKSNEKSNEKSNKSSSQKQQ